MANLYQVLTIIQNAAQTAGPVIYPDILHSLLNMPDDKRMIVGLAVEYPDLSSPEAAFRSNREPIDTLVTWHGFD
ncbi:MAG: hypothetical protein HOC20_10890 [Chloroflexi bacterium]|jgi:hypothetical protein|nr:hypothetical protein [Chloroflexota bacterium]